MTLVIRYQALPETALPEHVVEYDVPLTCVATRTLVSVGRTAFAVVEEAGPVRAFTRHAV